MFVDEELLGVPLGMKGLSSIRIFSSSFEELHNAKEADIKSAGRLSIKYLIIVFICLKD